MDLRQVRTFVTVAEQGSVSRAALRLHITQPALSRQVHDLQQELGLKLFDRIGRGLVLTPEGEQLLVDCRALLNGADILRERAQTLLRGDSGVLKVAASPVQIEAVFSTFLQQYARRYPRVEVKLVEAVGPDILTMLERGDIQLGILLHAVQVGGRPFGSREVPPVELLAACHTAFRPRLGKTIEARTLATFPLLLLDTGFVVRKTFDAVCRLAKLKPKVVIESRAPSNLLALAEAGHGIAVVPSVVLTHRYKLRTARITHEGKPLRESLSIMWDSRRVLPRYAKDFCELLALHMHNIGPAKRQRAHARRRH
jgi:LysR family nitrogen assimilation transcriptional regulator